MPTEEMKIRSMLVMDLDGVPVRIPAEERLTERTFVSDGFEELVTHCQAAWLSYSGGNSLHFRLVGPPGVGKNELVYHLARQEKKPLYIMHGHEELTPEDIACTARITKENHVEYVGSPLLAAMINGGICFFDEIGKVPSRSLSLLASVLDDRRRLTSVLAGFTQQADPGFRFCAALNDRDADESGLPGYIDERLRPVFRLDYPSVDVLIKIVQAGIPEARDSLIESFRTWESETREIRRSEHLSPRECLILVGFAANLLTKQKEHKPTKELIADAARQVLDWNAGRPAIA